MGQVMISNFYNQKFYKFILLKFLYLKGLDLQSNQKIALRLRRVNPRVSTLGFHTLKPEAVHA